MSDKSLKIGRYNSPMPQSTDNPDGIRMFTGWIEPADRSWITFLGHDGRPALYWAEREPSGAVIGEPVVLDGLVAWPTERMIVDAAAELP